MTLRRWGIVVSQAPLIVYLWRRWLSCPPVTIFNLLISFLSLSLLGPALALRTHALWTTQLRLVPPRRKPISSPQVSLEVICALSADSWFSGIPKPLCLTLWHRVFQNLSLTSSLSKIAGKKVSIRASYIGPTIVKTLGTVLCIYCHYS